MKSRKLKAIFAALSAVAVMATAMTGFAAATTTYDMTSNKVIVKETVTAEASKEVTYLVKSNGEIVYIDQTTADGSGVAEFEYKIDIDDLASDLSTIATFGTDGTTTPVSGGSDVLALKKFDDIDGEGYTVTFAKAITGNSDKATATVAAETGYEITDVKINGESTGGSFAVELGINDVLTVEAKLAKQDVTITSSNNYVDDRTATCVINYTGDNGTVGVICGKQFYPALAANDGKAAVQLIIPEKVEMITTTDFYAHADVPVE